jgi:hypothetical protein
MWFPSLRLAYVDTAGLAYKDFEDMLHINKNHHHSTSSSKADVEAPACKAASKDQLKEVAAVVEAAFAAFLQSWASRQAATGAVAEERSGTGCGGAAGK